MLEVWEREQTFEQLRERNRGGPNWSFVDGPVTANRPALGVHTAWGRTLKDVFQRYKALRGFDQRYQNGFDCQGLWIEVGVERSLGLNSKREIEEYGLEEFARRCREVVVGSSEALTRGSIRLGQWMDWGNDYFTFSDTNIEYIWKFLKIVHERGWLYLGHRSTEWCPRCGTSLSQHELTQAGVYQDRADPSLFVRFPLLDRPGESVVVWTTTPWTLPANVAAAVHPDEEYGRRENGEWVAASLFPKRRLRRAQARQRARRLALPRSVRRPPARFAGRPSRHPVGRRDDGPGHGHRPHRAGLRRRGLRARRSVHDLPVLTPVDESGRFYDDYGWLHGALDHGGRGSDHRTPRRDGLPRRGRAVHARLSALLALRHAAHLPVVGRLVHRGRRDPAEAARRERDRSHWVPAYMGKRMDDWLRNMGDWNISRRRYYGLPLPFYPCACGHLNVIGSRAELEERAVEGLDQLRSCAGRGSTACRSAARAAASVVTRIPEVGDVWLDAGIVPFATLGWENPERIPEGYATGAATRADQSRPARPRVLGEVVPRRLGREMREQIRLWFYSQFFMSVRARRPLAVRSACSATRRCSTRHGREMHASWGNTIAAEDAFAQMGADVMRWQFCAQPPDRNLLFGFGPAHEIKRRLLTFWNSVKFLVDYGNIEGFAPTGTRLEPIDADLRPLDRWLVERTKQLVRRLDCRLRGDAHGRRRARLRGIRRRRLELVHPSVAPPLLLLRRSGRFARSGTRSSSRCA